MHFEYASSLQQLLLLLPSLFSLAAAGIDTHTDTDTFAVADTDTLGRKSQNYWQFFLFYMTPRRLLIFDTLSSPKGGAIKQRAKEIGRERERERQRHSRQLYALLSQLVSAFVIAHKWALFQKNFPHRFFYIYVLRKQLFKQNTHILAHTHSHVLCWENSPNYWRQKSIFQSLKWPLNGGGNQRTMRYQSCV